MYLIKQAFFLSDIAICLGYLYICLCDYTALDSGIMMHICVDMFAYFKSYANYPDLSTENYDIVELRLLYWKIYVIEAQMNLIQL